MWCIVSEKDGREAVVDEREESKRQTKERTAPKKKKRREEDGKSEFTRENKLGARTK